MKNKFFKAVLLVFIAFSFIVTISFAANEEVKATNIGNEITSSIEKNDKSSYNLIERNADAAETNVKDGARSIGNDIGDGVRSAGNMIENGADKIENSIENGARDVSNMAKDGTRSVENTGSDLTKSAENGMDNAKNAIAGETTNVTSGETTDAADSGMNPKTWVWIIIAVIAVLIIAAVWYYAANKEK